MHLCRYIRHFVPLLTVQLYFRNVVFFITKTVGFIQNICFEVNTLNPVISIIRTLENRFIQLVQYAAMLDVIFTTHDLPLWRNLFENFLQAAIISHVRTIIYS